MSDLDRQVLFQNEGFFIAMVQAVSGGSIVGALAQGEMLESLIGRTPFAIFITAAFLAISTAAASAYWRHQYKMWDVKSQASKSRNEADEASRRSGLANLNLARMRRGMALALAVYLLGTAVLLVGLWYQVIIGGSAA